ncbi:uncharacterized Zn finger protein (UPF0148 family) [Paenibacillus anaericanus]|uniref:stalk domain-containing protein n=1 Tax=Paenibacillus anaericanus TaxID=170367 RepID=UPI00277E6942|nr:stalk domain-containing protein [Paenibacillus anaericanus]MDQ0091674.1 uncharacterized Zn finger protein (UPF0148 family) [Paenibacillus anaericanus]
MKKSLYTIMTLCIGIIIGMTSTAAAAPVKELVQASFDKIIFVVNGEEKKLDSDPLVYKGTTYLPVRTVLNALGYDVGYKAETKTVTANNKVDTESSEVNESTQKGGQSLETTTPNTNDSSKKIEDLNDSISREKEVIETLKQLMQDAQERTDVSAELKRQKIEDYNKRIEYSEKTIKMFEEKIAELSK